MKMEISDVRKILRDLPEHFKKHIEKVITGEIMQDVICGDCGRVIGEVYKDGRIEAVTDGNGVMWMLAYRPRLDGFLGFQCRCGNDSRLSGYEKGVKSIEKNKVKQKDIEAVLEKVSKNPPKYKEVGGEMEVDKFIIRRLV